MEEKRTGFVLPVREADVDTGGEERGRPTREDMTSYQREDREGPSHPRDRSPHRIEDRPPRSGCDRDRGGRIRDRGGRENDRYGHGQDNYQSEDGNTYGRSMGDGTKDSSRSPCWDWDDGKCDRDVCGFYHKPRGVTVTSSIPVKGNFVIEGDKKAKAMMIVKMLQSQDGETRDFIRQQAFQDLN